MSIVAAFAVPHPPLIIPAVDRGRERGIRHTVEAYREVARRVAALKPDTIVISSPHTVMYRDYNHISPGRSAHGDFGQFGAPEARYAVTYDEEFAGTLASAAASAGVAAGTDYERDPTLDHATMIPLHFIQQEYQDFRAVRVGLSGQSPATHYRLGVLVQQVAARLGRRVVYVASGDLSHKLKEDGPYGLAPQGPVFDERICDIFRTGDFLGLLTMDPELAEGAAECGLRSFQIMAGALDRTRIRPELLSYEGPFGVGYGVAAFASAGAEGEDESRAFLDAYEDWHRSRMAKTRAAEDPYVTLARRSLESYVTGGERITPPADLPADMLDRRAGCFVSLKEDGELRGCIGTIQPVRDNLAEEICSNAISAGTRDPRFAPVRERELGELVYDVDVLSEPEPIPNGSFLDVRRYGVIVSTDDGRRGLLLPDLNGVDTVQEQMDIAARKGHIDLATDAWHLERFEVVRHT